MNGNQHCAPTRRILIVDDDIAFAESIGDIISLNHMFCEFAHSAQEALSRIDRFHPQIVLIDIRLGQESGLSLIDALRTRFPNVLCVMMTAFAHVETAVHALQNGAYDYLRKPFSGDELMVTLNRCFEKIELTEKKEFAEQQLCERNRELEVGNTRLREILDSTKIIMSCTNVPQFGPTLLREFARNMGAHGGSFYVRKNGYFIRAGTLDEGHAPTVLSVPLARQSIFEYVLREKKPLMLADIGGLPDIVPSGWGGYQNVSVLVFPLLDKKGNVAGLIALHDKSAAPFTEQDLDYGMIIASYAAESLNAVTATETLLRSEEKYRRLIETMNDGVAVCDTNDNITYVNSRFCEVVGYQYHELNGQPLYKFMRPDTMVLMNDYAMKHNGVTAAPLEIVWQCRDGSERVTLVSADPFYDDEQNVVGCCAVITDITERKKAEKELQQQKHESDNRVKELNCLFMIASLMEQPDISLAEIMQSTLAITTQALSLPEVACAQITIGSESYASTHFTPYDIERLGVTNCISRDIFVYGRDVGVLKVWYNTACPQRDVGPFLNEERSLVYAVADLVGNIVERKRSDEELQLSLDKLRKAMEGTIQAMAMTAEMRDPYTAGHQRRVSKLACAIAARMKLSEHEVEGIRLAAVIHDLGKIYVPAEILSKPGVISDIEFNIIKTHPQVGHDILKKIEFPWPIADIVHQHHERLDGTGYPQGLTQQNILLAARIIAVADTVEAMASHRPYRPSLGIVQALEEIRSRAGVLYDPQVVEVCTALFNNENFQFE